MKDVRMSNLVKNHSTNINLLLNSRLWADILRVHGYGENMRWERVSDDVVPVNISCIQDTPTTVFHITAYNSQVERIFDVKIQQPGEKAHMSVCLSVCLFICLSVLFELVCLN